MEASQALLNFKTKAQSKIKEKAKKPEEKNHNMSISQLECDWYSRLCPNFDKTTLRIITKK